jgi:4-carboxymuconolactone decarboxylase
MNRYPTLDESALSQDQMVIHDAITNGPRGVVAGPLRVWLQSPGLATQAQALGQYARYDSVLPPVLSELAILVTARYWSSGFEWSHHAPNAQEVGVPAKAIEAISQAKRFEFSDANMQAVFDFALELHLLKNVREATYDTALKALGLQACVDLVGICGYYTMISMTINVFDVPDGDGPMLPELDTALADYFAN